MLHVAVLKEHLQEALTIADRIRPKKYVLPILSHFLLETIDGRLRIRATDLEAAVSVYVGAKVEAEGAVTMPGDVAKKLVATLPDTQLVLQEGANRKLTIQADHRELTLDGRDPEDYPPFPEYEAASFEFASADLAKALDRTLFAAAKDTARPVLCTVRFAHEKGADVVQVMGADGCSASLVQLPTRAYGIKKQSPAWSVNIPIKILTELRRLLDKQDNRTITLAFASNGKAVRFGIEKPSADFDSMTVDGTYPNVDSFMNADVPVASEVLTDEISREVEAAQVVAHEDKNRVRLVFDGKHVTVHAQSTDGAKLSGKISAIGGSWRVCLDGHRLLAALKSMGTERVLLGEGKHKSAVSGGLPITIMPVGDETYRHVLMPIAVTW